MTAPYRRTDAVDVLGNHERRIGILEAVTPPVSGANLPFAYLHSNSNASTVILAGASAILSFTNFVDAGGFTQTGLNTLIVPSPLPNSAYITLEANVYATRASGTAVMDELVAEIQYPTASFGGRNVSQTTKIPPVSSALGVWA